MKFKVSKLIVSIGCGLNTPKHIQNIKNHLESIVKTKISDFKTVITKCKRANAKFKIKAGIPMGIKSTLRKQKISKFLDILKKADSNLLKNLKYNAESNSYSYGIKDHHFLKLQRYNYSAPVYGMNIQLVFSYIGDRAKYRRINPVKTNVHISEREAFEVLKNVVQEK